MRRLAIGVLALLVVGSACIFGGDSEDGEGSDGTAARLVELATAADDLAYEAAYRYVLSGPLAEGISYELRIAQSPPVSLRMAESTTSTAEGGEQTVRQWLVQSADANYACSRYSVGVRCVRTGRPVGLFDLRQVDEMFARARTPGGFDEVEELDDETIAGERGECFRAVPEAETPPPERTPQPRFTPTRFVVELCYSSDGVLLRGRRTVTGGVDEESEETEVPEDLEEEGRTEALLEATEVSREVSQEDVELPGPVVDDPSELEGP